MANKTIDLGATFHAKGVLAQGVTQSEEPHQVPEIAEPLLVELTDSIGRLRGYAAYLRIAKHFEGTFCAQAAHDLAWAYNTGKFYAEHYQNGEVIDRESHKVKRWLDSLPAAETAKLVFAAAEFVMDKPSGEQATEIVAWVNEYRDSWLAEKR